MHEKARLNFILSGKPMNGSVFGNKASYSRQAFHTHIRLFSFLQDL